MREKGKGVGREGGVLGVGTGKGTGKSGRTRLSKLPFGKLPFIGKIPTPIKIKSARPPPPPPSKPPPPPKTRNFMGVGFSQQKGPKNARCRQINYGHELFLTLVSP